MFVEISEMNTHIFEENMDLIDGGDDIIMTSAIDSAVSEAKSYLSGYDVAAIFGTSGSARHPLLVTFIKDMALWHFLNLANPGNELEFRRSRYNAAIDWLKGVRRGDNTPDLPRVSVTTSTPGKVSYGGNDRRNNHY